ncbi:MAG TPA: 6-phosphofructokinase [Planctomycetota bacterium]|nr:6-phosphofructokinase [Planctomycetota bacterium]
MASEKGKLGILVGGGPAPGINSVIGAATIEAVQNGLEVVGIYDGFKWLMRGDTTHITPLTIGDVSQARVRGGSILHTSRANPKEKDAAGKDKVENVLRAIEALGLDYLMTIGGDDTASSAIQVAKAAKGGFRIAHVPKTIDNDLPLPLNKSTFGFQTARTIAAELVRNLVEDARTTRRWYLAVLMGRSAGHLALGSGNVAGATLTLIPEEFTEGECSLDGIYSTIEGAMAKCKVVGHDYGVACLAEGVGLLVADELYAKHKDNPLVEFKRDEFGHIRLGEVPLGLIFKRDLQNRAKARGEKMTIVDVTIGYDLRCAAPIPYDADYTQELGWGAVRYLLGIGEESFGTHQGAMISVQAGEVVPIPFSDILDEKTGRAPTRRVNINSDVYRAARANMIRVEKKDLADAAWVAELAEAAKMTPDDFRAKFGPLVGA